MSGTGSPPAPPAAPESTWPLGAAWTAAYRVFLALAALWAAGAVPLWVLGGLPLPDPAWHAREMLFGLGGAAVAGYMLSASSSWSGRAPVSGWPVLALAGVWLAARAAAAWPGGGAGWLAGLCNAGHFWGVAGLLLREYRLRRPRPEARRGTVAAQAGFCLLAGVAAGALAAGPALPATAGQPAQAAALLFGLLLAAIGGRMVPAFLEAAQTRDRHPGPSSRPATPCAALTCLGLAAPAAALGLAKLAALAALAAGLLLAVRMRGWPLGAARRDALAAMLLIAFAWVLLGLMLWAGTVLAGQPGGALLHALLMGGMGGLILAVMARASARRGAGRLIARGPAVAGFVGVMLATALRLSGLPEPAALLWSAGWAAALLAHLAACRDPVPRPVFSARRLPLRDGT